MHNRLRAVSRQLLGNGVDLEDAQGRRGIQDVVDHFGQSLGEGPFA